MTKQLQRRLEAPEIWYIRRIMRISWDVKPRSNGNGRLQIFSKPSEKDNYNFLGHINRAVGIEKQLLSGKICGTKSRGRQLTKYTDSLNNFVTRKDSPNNELIRRTDDREDWKAMIADVCNRPGT